MFDEKNRYVIRNYQKKPTFSSFLPGIAGTMGVPLWCYYNNRGQAVCSFGARDKDHAIMEFSAAHVAYREVSRLGFRTFLKINGEYHELFTENCDMHIGASEVEITAHSDNLCASAVYFGLPNERCAALVRVLTLKNTSKKRISIELLDGMPEVVSYGVNQDSLKNMPQLSKAWMRAEDYDRGLTCFRVRASMADSARVTEVKGVNFCIAINERNELLKPLVQPSLVFGEDTSLSLPEGFLASSLGELILKNQIAENCFPCCFLPAIRNLEPNEELKLYELYGQADEKSIVSRLASKITNCEWFEKKQVEAQNIVSKLTSAAAVRTADPVFDEYCRITYLDNLLRGGAPIFFEYGEKRRPFYVYSRKHGDPEREYNYFSLGGEYFAQGNGNFRDINQNRRSDVLFAPDLKDANIHTFYDLIQTDGYNPLVITAAVFRISGENAEKIVSKLHEKFRGRATELLSKPFTPGAAAMSAEDWGMSREDALCFTSEAVCLSESEPDADFQEGYWCDHWDYNIDLIESFLAVYPEEKQRLLFDDRSYRWYSSHAAVKPRAQRYFVTENGLRQYNAVEARCADSKWDRTISGEELRSTLIEKILLLCALKTATLDSMGMGIEMEAGKPGWYDALNGLPGLLGSSMAESCELLRLIRFSMDALAEKPGEISLYLEIATLINDVSTTVSKICDTFERWEKLNDIKEKYRADALKGYVGERVAVSRQELFTMLSVLEKAVEQGIDTAVDFGGGILPTYFTFDTDETYETSGGVLPCSLKPTVMPLFLEGPVHWLKLGNDSEKKHKMIDKIRCSGLYDNKLNMYKVNESLKTMSFEAGRCKAFVPGWLENESIWLHMEYKYLLELLKSELYQEFSEAFYNAAVPFMDPDVYGRSPLENVSFIASSANPDESVWGRGFVARLSGSTAEFLQIWQIMFFGKNPFTYSSEGLKLGFEPFIPEYLMPLDKTVCATFLGDIPVTYICVSKSVVPGINKTKNWKIVYNDGTSAEISGRYLGDKEARDVRSKKVAKITVTIE